MAQHVDFLLVGGGPAGATAAETLRSGGAAGRIMIISAEPDLPYNRPPLSKQFQLGRQKREQLDIFSESEYRKQEIDVLLGTQVIAVDPKHRVVRTNRQEEIHYGKLLIATGTHPKHLDVPGSALDGICYLRTLADAEKIKKFALGAKHAVVVGGNFIGMELASSFTQLGIAVTLILRDKELLAPLQTPQISRFLLKYYQKHGVKVLFETTVKKYYGTKRVQGVVTSADVKVPCDFVALGVGVTPEIDFLQGSGIATENGILVDQFMHTNQPNIYAAGDVANYFDPVFGMRRRFEHWDNAVKQGRLAAKNMMGKRQAYNECSYFFSDIFDLSFEFFGALEGVDEMVERGSLADKAYALFYLKKNVPQALFTMGRPPSETIATESFIRNRFDLTAVKNKLSDPRFLLEDIPAQTVFILQGGGAMGAFESGAVKALIEAKIFPNIIAGVSIGAFNAAIIAGNPDHAISALEDFWKDLSLNIPDIGGENVRSIYSSWYSLAFGMPRFFQPRWLKFPQSPDDYPLHWISFYDSAPMKELLLKHVDFPSLKTSPIRLLVNAVNAETAELVTFDSYSDDITADHIVASGSLPPGLPWTTIQGKPYWDGGMISNSPLEQVIERCGATGKSVYIIDLYPLHKALPRNLMGVMLRKDEIIYSERVRKDAQTQELAHDFRRLIDEIMISVESMTAGEIRQRPHYIQMMGDLAPLTITRIVREDKSNEWQSNDHDFSRRSITQYMQEGYSMACKVLKERDRKIKNKTLLSTVSLDA
jgi:NTE family protein